MLAKAAIAKGDGKFSIEEIEVKNPIGDEVLVKIQAAGLCHTDHDSLTWGRTIILGHEGAGVVEAVGENVKSVKPGDKVILNWAIPCGTCFQCQEQNQHICENNSPVVAGDNLPDGEVSEGHARLESTLYNGKGIERSFNIGTLSTHTVVKEQAVVKYNTEIPFSSASIISCGVMTGYGSAVNTAQIKPGSTVAVIGNGGVGLNVIQGARISGAAKIIAIDTNPTRLEMAKQFGATHIIQANRDDKGLKNATVQVKKITGNGGADYAFECTAIPALGAAPLAMIRNAGTAVQVSGIEEEVLIDMQLFEWDKIYINPLYGKCRPQIDFPILLNLYQKGDLLLDEMVTTTYKFEDLEQAFADMLAGKNAKGVILFD
ncbi:Zn-dependent alcohol dehydrogenase [Wenyingzhuangia aestuarii]|uniref:Zn-dependent alcohol dehydrogenase n=1 Tax=Wenyingzhuangia aestuarii TaxID=1647582 RepID=UPI00143CBAE6|nr:Zn-dependent alcohol dehydrogenase [Wenyingzhuangia aestuarii]NJB83434.1 S-(hydroxymethyl)glutathione dehydrogenase/alcohol dehydrogenase [Wenyingzhuangia aestuarii]